MNLKAKAVLAVLIFACVVLSSIKLVRFIGEHKTKNSSQAATNYYPFSQTGQISGSETNQAQQQTNTAARMQSLVQYRELYDALSPYGQPVQNEPAVDTNELILNKYEGDYTLQRFAKAMQKATGKPFKAINLFDENLMQMAINNPQIQKILLEYTKDAAFEEFMERITTDKEFMQAVLEYKKTLRANTNKN
ncbi:MAG: hypothetical protein LBM71_01785 [Elusimicrobiota bacterium]|jgi:hypothetical protein|nr:hypothetical protein [Elusimicrobiota bacterium]